MPRKGRRPIIIPQQNEADSISAPSGSTSLSEETCQRALLILTAYREAAFNTIRTILSDRLLL